MDLKIEYFKKQNQFFRIGFTKFPAEYLGYSGYGACGVHTEKIIYVCTDIHMVLHQTRVMHFS